MRTTLLNAFSNLCRLGLALAAATAAFPSAGPVLAEPSSQTIEAFLHPPYVGTARENSIFDHSSPGYQVVDETITAFTGAEANKNCPNPEPSGTPPPTPGNCDRGYKVYWGYSLGDWLAYDGHNGIDFAPDFVPVLAAHDSDQVISAGWDNPQNHSVGFGLSVKLRHTTNGYTTVYGHLSAIAVQTCGAPGCAELSDGDVIGIVGSTGDSGGPHLHFGVYKSNGTIAVDPYGWTGGGTDPWAPNQQPESLWVDNPAVVPSTATTVLPLGGVPLDNPLTREGGTTVDDGGAGFSEPPSPCWTVASTGSGNSENDSMRYVTPVTDAVTCTAQWDLPASLTAGTYRIFVRIPAENATSEGAIYTIVHSGQSSQARVHQAPFDPDGTAFVDGWAYIGEYDFTAGGSEYVSLGNLTEDETADAPNLRLAADAVQFVPVNVTAPTPTPAVTATPTPTATPASSLSDGLKAYWKLDEASGMRADESGRGNALRNYNGVSQVSGKVDEAAGFNASGHQYLSHPDNQDLSATGSFTIAGWAKLTSKPVVGSAIAGKWASGYEYSLRYSGTASDRFEFLVTADGTVNTIVTVGADTFGSPTVGQWYFVVGWYNAENDELGISVDGFPNTKSYAGTVYDGIVDFEIGRIGLNYYWNGAIDEVGVWKRALTAEEIAVLYNNGNGYTYQFPGCPSCAPTPVPLVNELKAYWKLNEAGGTREDFSGWDNDLNSINGTGQTDGKIGMAANFVSASSQYLSHPDNSDLSATGSFTVAGWVKLLSKPSVGSAVAGKWTSIYEYALRYSGTSGGPFDAADRFEFQVSANGTVNTILSVTAHSFGSPSLDTWYFVVGWYDATKHELGISVNGVSDTVPYVGIVFDSNVNMEVGRIGLNFYWNGAIDEIGIWKRALTPAERAALYNNGNGCTFDFADCQP